MSNINLVRVSRTEAGLQAAMAVHYSQPKGFVGRNMCYAVEAAGVLWGYIVAGSATAHLPGRDAYFGMSCREYLNCFVNNIFYHVNSAAGAYPCRNFTSRVLREFRRVAIDDWNAKYGDHVLGFETLVELPRSGECYKRDGWAQVGVTKGFTCKRVSGKGTDAWGGKRVWDTDNLRPKAVLVRHV